MTNDEGSANPTLALWFCSRKLRVSQQRTQIQQIQQVQAHTQEKGTKALVQHLTDCSDKAVLVFRRRSWRVIILIFFPRMK